MKAPSALLIPLFIALAGPVRANETAPAASPVNLLPNGSFEAGSAGWLLVEIQMVGTKWGVTAEESTEGRRSLYIDRRTALGPGHTRLQGPYFEHAGSRPLLISAMVRGEREGTIAMEFTHGEIPEWEGPSNLTFGESFEIGPAWRRITLRVPAWMNQPRERHGASVSLEGASHTKGMAFFKLEDDNRVWIDAVQANNAEVQDAAVPPFAPAAPVELGWSVDHGGIFHERPHFEAVVANQGADPWKGSLHVAITDLHGHRVQDDTAPLDITPGASKTVPLALRSDRLGWFKAALTLENEDRTAIATDTLTMIRAAEEPGGDAIAVTLQWTPSDNRVNGPRSLERLGFTQTRIYHIANWEDTEPKPGEWVDRSPMLEALLGGTGLRTLMNFQYPPRWISPNRKAYSLEHLDAYKQYARRALTELRPWLSAASFVNEPNAFFLGSNEVYRVYQNVLYETVKEWAPELDVVGLQPGSRGGCDVDYVEEMLGEGGGELVRDMDVLAVQTHAGWAMEDNRWAKRLADLRKVAERHGIERIWTTEMQNNVYSPEEAHFPTRGGREKRVDITFTDRNQADRLTQAALYSLASTFQRFYAFHFMPVSPANGLVTTWGMSRVNHLMTPRPVLASLSVANRLLDGTRGRGAFDFVTPGLWGGTFAGEDRQVVALWSVAGPQHVRINTAGDAQLIDSMGNPVPSPDGAAWWVELTESPLYVVSPGPEADVVAEGLAVSWEPGKVWSGAPLRGEAALEGTGEGPGRTAALRLRKAGNVTILWENTEIEPAAEGTPQRLAWAFPLDAEPGPLPLVLEGVLEDGSTVLRRFAPVVLGDQSERAAYQSGKPLVVEDFESMEIEGNAGRSARGTTWEAKMVFPWHRIYGPSVKWDFTAQDGFVRAMPQQKLGQPARGKTNWPAIECVFDPPLNFQPYEGLRVRYRMDRRDRGGNFAIEPQYSAMGVVLGSPVGNRSLVYGGVGDVIRRDGDWFVTEIPFENLPVLANDRSHISFLHFWCGPANDKNPVWFSMDHVELMPRWDPPEQDAPGGRSGQIDFDE
jgi:hypothetical protein